MRQRKSADPTGDRPTDQLASAHPQFDGALFEFVSLSRVKQPNKVVQLSVENTIYLILS